MSRLNVRLRLLATLPLVALMLGAAQDKVNPYLALRADLADAPAINRVLAAIAESEYSRLRKGQSGEDMVREHCGAAAAALMTDIRTGTDETGWPTVTHPACLRIAAARTVTIKQPTSIARLLAQRELTRGDLPYLPVIKGSGTGSRQSADSLLPQDQVIIPQFATWTNLVLRGSDKGKQALIDAVAQALECGQEVAVCLSRHKVHVLERSGPDHPSEQATTSAAPPASPVPEPSAPPAKSGASMPLSRRGEPFSVIRPAARLYLANATKSVIWLQGAVAQSSGQKPVAPSVPREDGGVDPEQWPYDSRRIALLLTDPRFRMPLSPPAIGVADIGLASADGGPLKTAMFQVKGDDDDDTSSISNDRYGAGFSLAANGIDQSDTLDGDLRLCDMPLPPDFSTWDGQSAMQARHGAVVGTVAAALPIREAMARLPSPMADADAIMPKLVFFRTLGPRICTNQAWRLPREREVSKAIFYLFGRTDIVNLSSDLGEMGPSSDFSSINDVLSMPEIGRVLTVPAGNAQTPAGIDYYEGCPICLITKNSALLHLLIVGAAERSLARASYSNFGLQRVHLYAPGGSEGAWGLDGNPAPATDRGTSLASARMAVAASLLRGFNLNLRQLRGRLQVAGWPLRMEPQSGVPQNPATVVDLLKVAAVRADALEFLSPPDPVSGARVRKTLVGTILIPDKGLKLCENTIFKRTKGVQAIRLAPPDGDTWRDTWTYKINKDLKYDGYNIPLPGTCAATDADATVTIDDVLINKQTINARDITMIQWRWPD